MSNQSNLLLQELYNLTKAIHNDIQHINTDMEKNDEDQLEKLDGLVSKRKEIIERLAPILLRGFEWTPTELENIQQMREWELGFQPQLAEIYQGFTQQINRLQQGKQISKRYHEGNTEMYMDGVYFDKRK